jgi:hypothetical protein
MESGTGPWALRHRAPRGAQFTQRYPSSIPAEQVYVINGIEAATVMPRGTLLKRVVGGVGR